MYVLQSLAYFYIEQESVLVGMWTLDLSCASETKALHDLVFFFSIKRPVQIKLLFSDCQSFPRTCL